VSPRAVTFDFWGTLFVEGPGYADTVLPLRYEALLQALSEAGLPEEGQNVQEAYRQAGLHFEALWKAGRSAPPYERVRYLFWLLGLPQKEEQLSAVTRRIEEASLSAELTLLPGAREALPELARHAALAIVSDTGWTSGAYLKEHLRRHGLLQYFQAFSFSDATGVVKPHPQAFLKALDPLGLSPREALHIGDLPQTDLVGACQVGYGWVVHYIGHRALEGLEGVPQIRDHRELLRWFEEAA